MEKLRPFIWVLLFGSLWGISEAVGGEILYSANIPHASVWLSVWALFLLSFVRAQINTPGTSSAVGAIAVLFRWINAAPFICHLLGIFLLGVAFDLAATLFFKKGKKILTRSLGTGILGAYGGYALFAFIITYIVRYPTWVEGGWPKVTNHILAGGSLAAFGAAFFVPLGFWLSRRDQTSKVFRSGWATTTALALILFIWVMGRLT